MTFLEETWLDKTQIDSEIKRLKWTQYEPIKISKTTQIPKIKTATQTIWNPTKNCTKIAKRTIEQDAPIGNSKQHTNSKRKLKQQDNMETIWTTRK